MNILIRVADVLSADEALELSDHRALFEDRVRTRLRTLPVAIEFDWTLIETGRINACQFFDRNGYPTALPPRLASLAVRLNEALAEAVGQVGAVLERSPTRSRRWLARAEEYRTIADQASSPAGREAYLALAASCRTYAGRLAEFGKLTPPPPEPATEIEDEAPEDAARAHAAPRREDAA